jgi:hypothetical protein
MELSDALGGLTPQVLADMVGTHVTTARRWLRHRAAPRCIMFALMFLRFGDLGALSADWDGWTLRGGLLWSPEGVSYTPGEVRAAPLERQAAEGYRQALAVALRAAESDTERQERIAALAALSNAHAAAAAALARLSGGLTPQEGERLFSALDSTREQRARLERR